MFPLVFSNQTLTVRNATLTWRKNHLKTSGLCSEYLTHSCCNALGLIVHYGRFAVLTLPSLMVSVLQTLQAMAPQRAVWSRRQETAWEKPSSQGCGRAEDRVGKKGISSYGTWTSIKSVQSLSVCSTHEYLINLMLITSWWVCIPLVIWHNGGINKLENVFSDFSLTTSGCYSVKQSSSVILILSKFAPCCLHDPSICKCAANTAFL